MHRDVSLLILSLIFLVAVGSLGVVVIAPEVAAAQQPGIDPPQAVSRGTVAAVQLPPTWTLVATPTLDQASVGMARPRATLPPTTTPLASLTPYDGWRAAIGYSVKGRPIYVYRFGGGPSERMIVAGMHGGNEWNTIALAEELLAHLRRHPQLVPSDVTLYILPSLNPDGEARAHSPDGRVNENGVDLNRNWDADWRADWPRKDCWNLRPTTGGAYAGSEPETQALMDFLLTHHVQALINYHSAALGIFPAGDPPDLDSARLAQAIDDVSDYPYPPIKTGCPYSGTLVDWGLGLGVAGVDLELTDHENTDFDTNLRILDVLLHWEP